MGRGEVIYIPPEVRRDRRSTVTVEGTPTQPPSIQKPVARIGIPIPYIVGQQRVFAPNVIWYGNLQPEIEITRTSETTTYEVRQLDGVGNFLFIDTVTVETITETKNVVGYTVDMQIGVCLGEGVILKGIYADNELIWSGEVGPARTEFNVSSNTFINGQVIWSGGAFDQAPDPYLAQFVTDLPGYVGVANLILKNLDVSVSLGQLSFEVARYPNPLGLPDAKNKIGDDINVASALAEIMSNPWGAGGIDVSAIDVAGTFTTAANTLADEANGCSLIVQTESDMPSIIRILTDQAQGYVYENPATAKIQFTLVRPETFTFTDVVQFGESDIIDVQNFRKTSWADTTEQLRGEFTSRAEDYTSQPVFAQNVALVSSASGRGKRTSSRDYPAVMVEALAQVLVSRDLANAASPIYSTNILVNRKGSSLLPGDLILVNWRKYSLVGVIFVVEKVRQSPIDDNNVVLECQQLILGDPTPVYSAPEPALFAPVNTNPVAPTAVNFITAPFWIARQAGTGISAAFSYGFVYPLILPLPANDIQTTFKALVTNVPNTNGDVTVIPPTGTLEGDIANSSNYGLYPTIGLLDGDIDQFDATTTGILTSVAIDGVINDKYLTDIGIAGVRAGALFLIINNEFLSFESVTDLGGGSWQLNNVHRALLDTVPQSHLDNDPIFVIPNTFSNMSKTSFDLPFVYTPAWNIISNSPTQLGNPTQHGITVNGWLESDNRTNAPLRPHDSMIDSNTRSATPLDLVENTVHQVTWRTRSRTVSGVSLQLDPAETGEIDINKQFQFHRVLLVDSASTLHDLGATLQDAEYNSLNVTIPLSAVYGVGTMVVRAETVNGLSLFHDSLPVRITPPIIQIDSGSFVLSGVPITIDSITTNIDTGAFALTGNDLIIDNFETEVEPGVFTLTGVDAQIEVATTLEQGNFTLTGNDALISAFINIEPGNFTLTGNPVGIGTLINIEPGNFTLTGNDADIAIGITLDGGFFAFTGNPVEITPIIPIGAGAFVLTGNPAGIEENAIMIDTGAFTLTGNDAGITGIIDIATGLFTLTGNSVGIEDNIMIIETGAFTLTGVAVSIEDPSATGEDSGTAGAPTSTSPTAD